MAEFKWDDDVADPMDGFDTDPTPTPVPPPRHQPSPILNKKPHAPPPVKPSQAAVQGEVDDLLEDSPDPAELTEAEWRLEKAGFYRAVINSQLLSSEHPAAIEVETELQNWAKEQLETLLGLRAKATGGTTQSVERENQFTEEEAAILRQLVVKVQLRSAGVPTPAPVNDPAPVSVHQSTPKAPTTVQPAAAKPKATVTPVATQDTARRGRGRPRKNPCRMCGKMECEHKRTAPQPSATSGQPKTVAPTTGEMYDGLPIQQMQDGTKFVESPDGRRYKLELRQVTHKQTGEARMAYIPIELSKIEPNPLAKPYPSEQEVMAMAAVEAAKNAGAMQSLTAATTATGTPRKFTGTDLINAAMSAPEREAYIPEPPERKR